MTTQPELLLPWPSDALMLVCATPEEALTDQMDSVESGECRDCGCAVVFDGYCRDRLLQLPDRLKCGRPIKYFCAECATHYRLDQFDHFEDHRGRPGRPPR